MKKNRVRINDFKIQNKSIQADNEKIMKEIDGLMNKKSK